MARIVSLPATNPLFDFPSEEELADRRGPSLARDASDDALSAFSRERQPMTSDVEPGASGSDATWGGEVPSRLEAGYNEFMRILERSDA